MEVLDLELRLAPYLCERGNHVFITNRTDGDDNSDEQVHDVHPSRKKICLFRRSILSTANAHLDLDLRPATRGNDPLKESCDGVASCSLDDIIEFVLPYLDKESLVRSKAVSRSWNRLVSAQSHLPIKFSFSGIVFQDTILDSLTHDSVRFLQLDCTGGATPCSPHGIGRDWVLVDSCNGLLLFWTIDEIFVYDPIKEAVAIVPEAGSLSKKYRGSCSGLAFDGQQYKVVSIFRSSDNEFVIQIFFSNEIASRRLRRRRIGIPDLVNRSDLSVNGSFFSFKGCLSFLLCDWLLIYAAEKGRCSYMRLPHGAEASIHRRCMWQSEGRIYYGFGRDDGGFQIWELAPYGDDHSDFDAKKSRWEFVASYNLETLVKEYPEIFGAAGNTSKDRIGPCAFNDDFQILYLHSPGKLVAYHLKTGRFQMAFTYPDNNESGVSSTVLSYCFRPKPCNFLMEGSSGDLDRLSQNASSLTH